jgi:signal transduction histidine kinase
LAEHGELHGYEYHFRTLKGSDRWVLHDAFLSTDPETGEPVVEAIMRDITAIKEAQEKLRRKAEELQERNAELDSFVHTVSHDLKSPLVAIAGFAQLLEKKCADAVGPTGQRYLQKVVSNVMRMREHIDDLLELARVGRDAVALEPVNVAQILREVLDELQERIQGRGARIDVPEDLPVVGYQEVRMRQLLRNLVENALKFMGDQPDPNVAIEWTQSGGEICFAVRDNGIGVAEERQEAIFEVFRRLPEAAEIEGTGVGLALVRRIVQIHGGRVWVHSAPGKGSTFYFTVPESKPAAPV